MPDLNSPQLIIAFDFGTQKMGMAVGSSLIESATPLALFPMKDGIPNWDELLKIVKQHQPNLFLVGLPLNMDDSESELSTRARKFARRLRHQTNIETVMVDERLTTREARDELEHYQAQGRAKKLAADSIAAALFIESWYRNPEGITP
ncbi:MULTISPECIES: Holliday junction resolvase RuvX [Acinetobacter]|jgi:putative Holliday junction resolvase|uniref:Putative pre-16S rRNA nuclease n=2 Tax=Acinetobacter bereziniae TaxID=106648 RepID=N9CUS3_ACIBZ|nr:MULTISPECIES: Holliday junction resolvase RuvX [Acinetobacter]RIJ76871.1 Holliday junction resolvase RuvX [Nakamurella silvestris]ATZ65366.1 Holliday junction DNA helicase RuvA [Acinetobacter bereziniae]ENV19412.1 YqgF family RNAse H domain-containing protein [Acinetobacter bereziniae NIPH 3]ENV89597.1 YqgF family RNAse H domain-containing protein [Acinetobacter bereziniae LMG 1003 = CIP 70.12]MBI0395777.1 Holliday junction resolvase RuvX [Acinetobacter bereziniae]